VRPPEGRRDRGSTRALNERPAIGGIIHTTAQTSRIVGNGAVIEGKGAVAYYTAAAAISCRIARDDAVSKEIRPPWSSPL
jgi:hypothetical protein